MDWHLANKQQKLSFNAYQPDLQGPGASPGQDLISVSKWPQSDCSAQLVVLLPCKSQQKLFSFLKQLTCDDPRNDGVGLVWFQLGVGRSSQVGHWRLWRCSSAWGTCWLTMMLNGVDHLAMLYLILLKQISSG